MSKLRTLVGIADPSGRVWQCELSGIWCYECSCGQKGAYDEEIKTRQVLADHQDTDPRHIAIRNIN